MPIKIILINFFKRDKSEKLGDILEYLEEVGGQGALHN